MGYLNVERKPGGYAIVSLCREPVNTLDLVMWQQLKENLTQLEADPTVQGVIYTSGLKRDVFTAGNDLMELLRTQDQRRAVALSVGPACWVFPRTSPSWWPEGSAVAVHDGEWLGAYTGLRERGAGSECRKTVCGSENICVGGEEQEGVRQIERHEGREKRG
eukprot:jgi/Botrbrau1/20763/Bobra.0696s0002.1